MINHIKKHLLNRSLKHQKVYREKVIVSLEQTHTIGMLCQISDEDSYKDVYNLFSKLHSPKRVVKLMGYIDEKTVPFFCLPQLSADYFCKKHLNWYGKPNFAHLKDFAAIDFDILIDFSRNDLAPLHYLLTVSKAKLIVGANEHAQDFYDIYFKDETNPDNFQLLKTIHNYLLKLTGG